MGPLNPTPLKGETMSETETDSHGQRAKISRLAIASVSLGVLGFLILYFRDVIFHPRWARVLIWHIMGLLGISGFVLGVAALVRIKRTGWMLKGGGLAIVGMVLAVSISHVWLIRQMDSRWRLRLTGRRSPCWYNLWELGRAMSIYASDSGRYPDPNQWCDLLLKHGKVDVKHFVCPSIVLRWPSSFRKRFIWPVPKEGRCHFAMNPKCNPSSPNDVVLLFEAKEGWNQFGGPEMLTFVNRRSKGCRVLFNERRVELVKPAEIERLNWGQEKGQTGEP